MDTETEQFEQQCQALGWKRKDLLTLKPQFEDCLSKTFDNDYFMENIKILYPIVRYKRKLKSKEKEPQYVVLFEDIYDMTHPHNSPSVVLLKIDYSMFHPKMNNQFKTTLYHQCGHNMMDCQFKTTLYAFSSYVFVMTFIDLIKQNIGYTTSPNLIERFTNYDTAKAIDTIVECIGYGCCMECAVAATLRIARCCYMLSSYQDNNSTIKKHPSGCSVFNIDMMCILCIWLANILEHSYIRIYLKQNQDMMPTIHLTLLRLMATAHILCQDNPKTYKSRRKLIYFSIWRLLKQIVINYGYIKKFYQCKDLKKDRFCEMYQVEMIRWTMDELSILEEILEQDMDDDMQRSFKYNYFGPLIVLLSLMTTLEHVREIRMITHQGSLECAQVMEVWLAFHSISHNVKEVGELFKESIVKANKIKKMQRIKCQWRSCKKWKHCSKFYRCKRCKTVKYCSRNCQKKDWVSGFHNYCCKDSVKSDN